MNSREDDASLAQLLEREANKHQYNAEAYRAYTARALDVLGEAFMGTKSDEMVSQELSLEFAKLQDAVAPADPSAYRDALLPYLADGCDDPDKLLDKITELLDKHAQ